MDSIEVLPNVDIQSKGTISESFLEREIKTFCAACCWVQDLPYGANSNNEDSLILFEENRGTCTTKHGAIARLAQELGLEVYKNLGFYRLNDETVTGVDAIIQPYGLSFIPQIHCFLKYNSFRIDLTQGNCNGKNKTIEDYDFVVRVAPDLTREEEEQYYTQRGSGWTFQKQIKMLLKMLSSNVPSVVKSKPPNRAEYTSITSTNTSPLNPTLHQSASQLS